MAIVRIFPVDKMKNSKKIQNIQNRRVTLKINSSPLGSSGIRRNNDSLSPLRDVLLDPLQNGRLGIEIID
jgi:hypothetical protein